MRNALLLLSLALAPAASAQVVIAEVYGGGGNTGAPYKEDYVVLYNNGATSVDLSGYSIQYASVQGTSWAKQNLTGSIAGNGFYYILLSTGGNGNGNVPFLATANLTASPMIQVSGRRGRVALSSAQTAYVGNTPTNPHIAFANLVDFIGWGGGTAAQIPSQYEGASYAGDMNVNNSIRRKESAPPSAQLDKQTPLGASGVQAITFIDNNNNGADNEVNNLSGGALPVEMVNFTARADDGRLRFGWTTASETNNAGFRIEGRASETGDWTVLGTLASKASGGTTTEAHDYSFVTGRMPAGRYEVRVLQNDLDGTVTVSAVSDVEVALDGSYELLVRGDRAVSLRVSEPQRVTVRLFDVTGRELARMHDGMLDGAATMAVPQGLATGMYLVRVEGERFSATRNVVLR